MVLMAKAETQEEEASMKNILRDVFPQSSRPKSGLPGPRKELLKAVEEQLAQDRLQPNKHMVDTVSWTLEYISLCMCTKGYIVKQGCKLSDFRLTSDFFTTLKNCFIKVFLLNSPYLGKMLYSYI